VKVKIRLVHLSDIHFGCENVDAVEAAIGAVQAFAPDLTIVSGDITANGRAEEFAAARAWLDRLPKPQISTPGNHDVPYWDLPARLVAPFKLYRAFVGRPDKSATYLPASPFAASIRRAASSSAPTGRKARSISPRSGPRRRKYASPPRR